MTLPSTINMPASDGTPDYRFFKDADGRISKYERTSSGINDSYTDDVYLVGQDSAAGSPGAVKNIVQLYANSDRNSNPNRPGWMEVNTRVIIDGTTYTPTGWAGAPTNTGLPFKESTSTSVRGDGFTYWAHDDDTNQPAWAGASTEMHTATSPLYIPNVSDCYGVPMELGTALMELDLNTANTIRVIGRFRSEDGSMDFRIWLRFTIGDQIITTPFQGFTTSGNQDFDYDFTNIVAQALGAFTA